MTREQKIIQNMIAAGTWRTEFINAVKMLAKLENDLKKAEKIWHEHGSQMIITQTNKTGAEYTSDNPEYKIIRALRADIIALYTQLGLTPAGLKKINDMKAPKPGISKLDQHRKQMTNGGG